VRPTSYKNPFFIIALLAAFYVTAPTQLPATALAPIANVHVNSSPPGQTDNLLTVHQVQDPAWAPASAPQAKRMELAQPPDRIEAASIIPDAGSLLPVAAVVGFSFLVGGIVSGAWKTRP
jgi:hypothetical protein